MRNFTFKLTVIFLILLTFSNFSASDVNADNRSAEPDNWLWNDEDSRQAAQALVADCLKGSWLAHFTFQTGSTPVIMVDSIRNRSSYHIDTHTLIHYLEEILFNSKKVTINLEKTEVDFIFYGEFNSKIEGKEDEREIIYFVYLELVELQTSHKVWIKTYQIRKPYKMSDINL